MNLQERMKSSLKTAMFEKNDVKKNILRVALGEIEQLQMSRQQGNRAVTDDQIAKILKQIFQSNLETLENTPEGDRKTLLESENVILGEFMPKQLTQEEIRMKLSSQTLPPGKAGMGFAMKYFKEQGDFVDGEDVKKVIESLG